MAPNGNLKLLGFAPLSSLRGQSTVAKCQACGCGLRRRRVTGSVETVQTAELRSSSTHTPLLLAAENQLQNASAHYVTINMRMRLHAK